MVSSKSSEQGFSLIELLVAVTILGIGVVAVVGALGTTIVSAGAHRSHASAETVTRDFAEAISVKANSTATYNPCPTAAQLTPTFVSPQRAGVALYLVSIEAPPAKYAADSTQAVQYWIPGGGGAAFPNGAFENAAACQAWLEAHCAPGSVYGTGGSYKPVASCDAGMQRVWVRVRSNVAALPKGTADSEYVDKYSRILVRRYDAPAPT